MVAPGQLVDQVFFLLILCPSGLHMFGHGSAPLSVTFSSHIVVSSMRNAALRGTLRGLQRESLGQEFVGCCPVLETVDDGGDHQFVGTRLLQQAEQFVAYPGRPASPLPAAILTCYLFLACAV